MKSIRSIAARSFEWIQPRALTRYWELFAGDETVASLKFEKMTGSLATATSADRQWTFKRSGFLHVRVHIRQAGSDQDIAVFFPRWNGSGTLEGPEGTRTLWYSRGFFNAEWGWQTETGSEILAMRRSASLLKHTAEVQIAPEYSGRADLALLTLFGFYLTILMSEDAAASAAIIS